MSDEMREFWKGNMELWDTMKTWDSFADPVAARAEVVAKIALPR